MDRVSRYGYINAKLRARIGSMISSGIIDAMIKAPNLGEAVAVLSGTQYDELAQVYARSADLQQVELALFSREVEIQKDIIAALDARPAAFVSVLLEKSEIENIKNAVRLWYSAAALHHSISYRAAYVYRERIVNDIDWTRIVNALTYDDLVKAFHSTPYSHLFEEYTEQRIQRDGLFDFEIALDHLWFDSLYGALDHLDRADREVAEKVYTVDADLKNILNLIRYGFYHNVDAARLSRVFIARGGLYSILEKKVSRGELTFADAREIIKRKYPEVNEQLGQMEARGELSTSHGELAYGTLAIENYLAKRRRKEFTSILSGDPFTIGTILSYIYLCRSEDNTIRAILSAKYYGWSEDQIRREVN